MALIQMASVEEATAAVIVSISAIGNMNIQCTVHVLYVYGVLVGEGFKGSVC